MYETSNSVAMFLNGTAMSGWKDHVHILGLRFIGERRTVSGVTAFTLCATSFLGLSRSNAAGCSPCGASCTRWIGRSGAKRLRASRRSSCREADLDYGTGSHVMLLELDRVPPGDKLVDIGAFGGWRAYLEYLGTKQQ